MHDATTSDATVTRLGWLQSLSIYLRPRLLLIAAQGFASGMPLLLTLSTLSYWLATVKVDNTTIGLFALTDPLEVGVVRPVRALLGVDGLRRRKLNSRAACRRAWRRLLICAMSARCCSERASHSLSPMSIASWCATTAYSA